MSRFTELSYNSLTELLQSLQVLQYLKPLNQLPLIGPLFIPPVNVTSVAKVAVRAAIDPVFSPGILDVYGIKKFSQQMSKID